MTSFPELLTSYLSCHDGLYPQPVSQNKCFLSYETFAKISSQQQKKITQTVLIWKRLVWHRIDSQWRLPHHSSWHSGSNMKELLVRSGGGSPKVTSESLFSQARANLWRSGCKDLEGRKKFTRWDGRKKNKENCQKTVENHEEIGDGKSNKIRGHPQGDTTGVIGRNESFRTERREGLRNRSTAVLRGTSQHSKNQESTRLHQAIRTCLTLTQQF